MQKIKNSWADLKDDGYNCFACAPENPLGLKMEFYEDGDDIVSLWTPRDDYQGWMKTLHGGIQATLMDEIGGWVIARKLQTSGMTTSLNIKYRKPLPTGDDKQLEIRAHIREQRRNFVTMDASIAYNGEVCSSAEITYYCFSQEKAVAEFYFRSCVCEEE